MNSNHPHLSFPELEINNNEKLELYKPPYIITLFLSPTHVHDYITAVRYINQ